MNTSRGEPTSALYGFSSLLLKILREMNPAGLAFALDAPKPTFRHGRYEAYKATRDAPTDDFRHQLARLDRLWACLEVPVFRVPGFEADDILATLARGLREASAPTVVLSGDRDLLQLARGSVSVLFTGARAKEAVSYDEARVIERFGVRPDQLPRRARHRSAHRLAARPEVRRRGHRARSGRRDRAREFAHRGRLGARPIALERGAVTPPRRRSARVRSDRASLDAGRGDAPARVFPRARVQESGFTARWDRKTNRRRRRVKRRVKRKKLTGHLNTRTAWCLGRTG